MSEPPEVRDKSAGGCQSTLENCFSSSCYLQFAPSMLPSILSLTLPGIDPADPLKTFLTLSFYAVLFSYIPLIDCTGIPEASKLKFQQVPTTHRAFRLTQASPLAFSLLAPASLPPSQGQTSLCGLSTRICLSVSSCPSVYLCICLCVCLALSIYFSVYLGMCLFISLCGCPSVDMWVCGIWSLEFCRGWVVGGSFLPSCLSPAFSCIFCRAVEHLCWGSIEVFSVSSSEDVPPPGVRGPAGLQSSHEVLRWMEGGGAVGAVTVPRQLPVCLWRKERADVPRRVLLSFRCSVKALVSWSPRRVASTFLFLSGTKTGPPCSSPSQCCHVCLFFFFVFP